MDGHKTSSKKGTLLSVLLDIFPQYEKETLFSYILCGNVQVNGETVRDHTRMIKKMQDIYLHAPEEKGSLEDPVSRGAYKIVPVLAELQVPVKGKVWLDCGCATGGFTQSLLEHHALAVHAVDVAYNTLDYQLRAHAQVKVHERTNILHVHSLTPPPHAAVVDLSFRSLRGVVSHIMNLCSDHYVLALCKPQFEYAVYRHKYDTQEEYTNNYEVFDGVLKDSMLVRKIIYALLWDILQESAYMQRIVPAGIKGRYGNQEYFLELVPCEHEGEKVEVLGHSYLPSEIASHYNRQLDKLFPSINRDVEGRDDENNRDD